MVLYNSSPLSLIHQKREIDRMGFAGYRLCFTNETEKQVKEVLVMWKGKRRRISLIFRIIQMGILNVE